MREYEALRRHWIGELERHGEVRRLPARALPLLERGSLMVFCAMRLSALDRRWRAARWVRAAAALTLFAALLRALLPRLAPGLPGLGGEPFAPLAASLAGAGLLLAGLGHLASLRAARRRALYERLERAVDPALDRYGA